jgi:molybdate transport system regulatory protein
MVKTDEKSLNLKPGRPWQAPGKSMKKKKPHPQTPDLHTNGMEKNKDSSPPSPHGENCLDSIKLHLLEQAFRKWVEQSNRADIRKSRERILMIFLIIRYTGAKLNEVLAIDPVSDINPADKALYFPGPATAGMERNAGKRAVYISEGLMEEIQEIFSDRDSQRMTTSSLNVDQGFVRKKFYERAAAIGIPKQMGGPEMIRKARAIELIQANMPIPAVQMMLGYATPTQASSYISFSPEEVRQVTRLFMEREASHKTSARNTFFGKIREIKKGDIQAVVRIETLSGDPVKTIITNDSLERLGLTPGNLITAEVKAPWVILHTGENEPKSSAENRFQGVVSRITKGEINTEFAVRISDGAEICALVSTEGAAPLNLREGDRVWALFSCFSVVLHTV